MKSNKLFQVSAWIILAVLFVMRVYMHLTEVPSHEITTEQPEEIESTEDNTLEVSVTSF
ncbi:MAG: hypothetical protein HRT74_08275 [Flavobacteriales bacterium]|nr:hypothetical protein [Flavobacteriales bacterium]